jgi:simple sugar transport system permease protein
MAGQFAVIIVTYLGISGIWGFVLCAIIALPLAIIFGFFVGALLNKTKGQEMIASMISGFFANGIYQLVLLFLVGTLIPMKMNDMMLTSGVGIRNTVDLKKAGLSYAIDSIHEIPLFTLILIVSAGFILFNIFRLKTAKHDSSLKVKKRYANIVFNILVFIFGLLISYTEMLPRNIQMLENITVPTVTSLLIIALCFFNVLITKTKLGQDFRTVGQNRHIAEIAGIHVNKVRMLAIIISTVLASWGQLLFLQNMGVLNTYGSHVQIALFSIAALLIGGASASKATISQALLGVVLFHTLFLVSPMAGKNLFDDPMIGEFFRAFIAYGVIGLSLGLHAWRKTIKGQV